MTNPATFKSMFNFSFGKRQLFGKSNRSEFCGSPCKTLFEEHRSQDGTKRGGRFLAGQFEAPKTEFKRAQSLELKRMRL